MTVKSRAILFCPPPNKARQSPPYFVVSKIKAVPEEKYDGKSPAGIGEDSSYYTLVIDDNLNMGAMSGGNCSLTNHTISQQYCDYNNGDVSIRYVFLNSHTLSQCEDSSRFKNIDDDVEKDDGDVSCGYVFVNSHTLSQHEYSSTFKNIDGGFDKGDVSSVCGSMNTHTYLQQNDLESLMKYNYMIDTDINET